MITVNRSELQLSTKWAGLNQHCAYRGKNEYGKTCSHLFSLSGKCKLFCCPIVQPESVTFQLDEQDNVIIAIEKTSSERIDEMWEDKEFKANDPEMENKIGKILDKYPAIKDIAEKKFRMLYSLSQEILATMGEEDEEESGE